MLQNVLAAIRERLEQPTSRGLASAVGRAVADGALKPGQKLLPIRAVASELGLSPTTVSAAWSLLARAGTITSDGRRGTVIAQPLQAGPNRYRLARDRGARHRIDLSTGTPDPALLPDLAPTLARLADDLRPETAAATAAATGYAANYLDGGAAAELIDLIRPGWPDQSHALTVVDGALDALDLIVRTRVHFSDRVAVENPTFAPLLDLLEAAGAEIVGVGWDFEGPVASSLAAAIAAGARHFFYQPRAQNPSGLSLTAARAEELAAVLAGTDVVVVENDSAGAMASSPLVSLAPLLPGRVLHVRSYSKSHGPDLRLAALGGSPLLLDPLLQRRLLGQGWTSRLLQRLLAGLLSNPETTRQVTRARREYARRRQAMVSALASHGVEVRGGDGLNLWLPVRDEAAAMVRLASVGIGVSAGAPFTIAGETMGHSLSGALGSPPAGPHVLGPELLGPQLLGPRVLGPHLLGPHLRVTIAELRTPRQITSVAADLAAAASAEAWRAPG